MDGGNFNPRDVMSIDARLNEIVVLLRDILKTLKIERHPHGE